MKDTRIGKLVAHMRGGQELRDIYPEESAAAFDAEVDRLYPETAGAAASSTSGLSCGLLGQHSTCAGCGGKEPTSLAYKRCSRCRRVVYCGAACQRSHWGAHKPRCGRGGGRRPDPAAVRAVVFPGDADVKPYEVWIPGEGGVGASFRSQASYLGRSLLGGAPPDGVRLERVSRGDPAAMACVDVAHVRRPRGAANMREATVVTARPDGRGAPPVDGLVATGDSNPRVRVRGDAVVVRRQRGGEGRLEDFSLADYKAQFGIFFALSWGRCAGR